MASTAYINFWGNVKDGLHSGFISNTEVDYSGGEADATIPGSGGEGAIVAEIYTDTDCHWTDGATANAATTSDKFLAAGERMSYWVQAGGDLSFIGTS